MFYMCICNLAKDLPPYRCFQTAMLCVSCIFPGWMSDHSRA